MLGVRRTSVTIIAKSLQHAGLIYYRRGHVTIIRPEGLQQKACECHLAIKMRYDTALVAARADKTQRPPPAEYDGECSVRLAAVVK